MMNLWWRQRSWFDVAVFEYRKEGQLLENFFEDQGIESRSYDDKLLRYFLFLRPPRVTFRVQVRKQDFNHAVDFLENRPPAVLEKALHCPSCGSLRVNYPQMTRKFLLPTLLLHVGIIFRIVEHECYCEKCHYIWNLPKEAPHKIRSVTPFPFN